MRKINSRNIFLRMIFNQVRAFALICLLYCAAVECKAETRVLYNVVGVTSWYGERFHGKKTASGVDFNQNAYSAAHRSLPFLSLVKVTNLKNKKSIVVIINDRGPKSRKRILDLSRAAAANLNIQYCGIARVKMELLLSQSQKLLKLAKSRDPKVVCEYFQKHRNTFH